jgi:hypothetical protein
MVLPVVHTMDVEMNTTMEITPPVHGIVSVDADLVFPLNPNEIYAL